MTQDANQALHDIESIGGISRILTSGQAKSVPHGLPVLEALVKTSKELFDQDSWGLTILPGSGINQQTVGGVLDVLLPLGIQEIHLSGGHWKESGVSFRPEGMGMGVVGSSEWGEWGVWTTDETQIREVKKIVDARLELQASSSRKDGELI